MAGQDPDLKMKIITVVIITFTKNYIAYNYFFMLSTASMDLALKSM